MKKYIGNPLQIRGVERYTLEGGKGDGMHFLLVRNGLGLEAWISVDRAGDVSRLTTYGKNMGFFSPCGYVSPQYYDKEGEGFLKSFTAGFFTTCGLSAVGSPCVDDGEALGLHGTVSNIPSEIKAINEDENGIEIVLEVRDCQPFGKKFVMLRKYNFSYSENTFSVSDSVTNIASKEAPFMIMYHCNMGYPLLSENSIVKIPNSSVTPRNEHAKENLSAALLMEKPQADYEECCFYYDVIEKDGLARAGIYNPEIEKGVVLKYKKDNLPSFTEWKMMGEQEYVLGLEPANCTPDGRDVLRKEGRLLTLKPDECKTTYLQFKFCDDKDSFENEF